MVQNCGCGPVVDITVYPRNQYVVVHSFQGPLQSEFYLSPKKSKKYIQKSIILKNARVRVENIIKRYIGQPKLTSCIVLTQKKKKVQFVRNVLFNKFNDRVKYLLKVVGIY